MGAQSLVLGKQFGEGFQYGKRKISAMSNEEFNKLTPAKLAQDNAEELKQMIPSMKGAITDMRSFQSFIVKELIETVKQLPGDIFGGLTGDLQTSTSFSKTGVTNTAYAGSLGLPAGALKGLVPGTQQFLDTQKLIDKFILDQANIVQNRKKTSSSITILKKQTSPKTIQRITTSAIATSGATGAVFKISTALNEMKFQLSGLKSLKKGLSGSSSIKSFALQQSINSRTKTFLQIAKKYNQFVLSNRNYGRKFRVDTAKSLSQTRLVFG